MNKKYLIIVTSSLIPNIGVIGSPERFIQTITGLKSIREKIPDGYIIFCDSSFEQLSEEWVSIIEENCDKFINFYATEPFQTFTAHGMKSHGELSQFKYALLWFTINIGVNGIDRIFKIGGRGKLTDNFDLSLYENIFGKYIFKGPFDSWMGNGKKLYETRMYSLCVSLISEYCNGVDAVINSLQGGYQVEHAYYDHLDKNKVLSFDTLGLEYMVSSTGQTAFD